MTREEVNKIQVSYGLFYQGIVIDALPGITDLSKYEIIAFKGNMPSGDTKNTVMGLANLRDIAGKALTCGIASALPWSDSAYYIAVYEIDPAKKEQAKQLTGSDVIIVRQARDLEIKKAHTQARALKEDIYAPLFLKGVTLKKRHVATGIVAAIIVTGGLKLAYESCKKSSKKPESKINEFDKKRRDAIKFANSQYTKVDGTIGLVALIDKPSELLLAIFETLGDPNVGSAEKRQLAESLLKIDQEEYDTNKSDKKEPFFQRLIKHGGNERPTKESYEKLFGMAGVPKF